MNLKLISTLKWARLVISILMASTLPIYMIYQDQFKLPDHAQLLTLLFGVFVFVLGLQYYFEKKNRMLSYFFMLFGVMMVIVAMLTLSFFL